MERRPLFCDFTQDIRLKAEKELGETEEVRRRSLKDLATLINDEPDFEPNTDESFLLRFLRVSKFNVRRAFETLKNFYQYKARYSRIITDFTPFDLKNVLDVGQCVPLNYRNTDDSVVSVMRIGQYDTARFSAHEMFALTHLVGEFCLQSEVNQVTGYTAVVDLAGFTWGMLAHYSRPTFVYRVVTGLQDCTPGRIKAYHIVNEPAYARASYAIVKSLLYEKFRKKIHFHGTNLASLHEHIPPDILPTELGGTNEPITTIADRWVLKLLEHEDHFEGLKKFGYVGETLRRLQESISATERRR